MGAERAYNFIVISIWFKLFIANIGLSRFLVLYILGLGIQMTNFYVYILQIDASPLPILNKAIVTFIKFCLLDRLCKVPFQIIAVYWKYT